MIRQIDLGTDEHIQRMQIRKLIRQQNIQYAGYMPGKIYGLLSCASGKRMKAKNRIFFLNEQEALSAGYRPCGHCMKQQYKEWIRHNQQAK